MENYSFCNIFKDKKSKNAEKKVFSNNYLHVKTSRLKNKFKFILQIIILARKFLMLKVQNYLSTYLLHRKIF